MSQYPSSQDWSNSQYFSSQEVPLGSPEPAELRITRSRIHLDSILTVIQGVPHPNSMTLDDVKMFYDVNVSIFVRFFRSFLGDFLISCFQQRSFGGLPVSMFKAQMPFSLEQPGIYAGIVYKDDPVRLYGLYIGLSSFIRRRGLTHFGHYPSLFPYAAESHFQSQLRRQPNASLEDNFLVLFPVSDFELDLPYPKRTLLLACFEICLIDLMDTFCQRWLFPLMVLQEGNVVASGLVPTLDS
ncbi:hypothetical protein RCL1_008422 [Eukaryota sp. TZLM3-RCL]